MADVLTSAQMRAVEDRAIAAGHVTGAELMARAGRGVVDAVNARLAATGRKPGRAVVCCGPGNNGGDGFVVARLLAAQGWQVAVGISGDPVRLPPDARKAHDAWLRVGAVRPWPGKTEAGRAGFLDDVPDLIVDAILGIGLSRDLDSRIAQGFAEIERCRQTSTVPPLTVAVDIPSGICADSGRNRGNHCTYDLTVTFHSVKPGHLLGDGSQQCGALEVVDIGLPHRPRDLLAPDGVVRLVNASGPVGKQAGHKFDHGHAVVLSGGVGRGGAARLAARGALRIGAGLVTLGCPPEALAENATQLNAVMLHPVRDPAALADWLAQDGRISAIGIGPALGLDARAAGLLAAVLASGRPAVLDADALSLLAQDPVLFAALHPRCVLTPHGGEFARLFPDLQQALAQPPGEGVPLSKIDVTRAAAARAGCAVLFKGPDTVIAAPDGICLLHAARYRRAVPWLATAGAGDVLTGFIAGLLARGFAPLQAAGSAVWLHVECARAFGPGLIAEDLPDALPGVFRRAGF